MFNMETKRRRKKPILERFFSKVRKTPTCWLWVGAKLWSGHGKFLLCHVDGKSCFQGAHRCSWWIEYGDIPSGLGVLHKCDNPSCVNPEHLFLGTQKDNMRDMDNKKRRGVARKLSVDDVSDIRLLVSFKMKDEDVAKLFGVTRKAISYHRAA